MTTTIKNEKKGKIQGTFQIMLPGICHLFGLTKLLLKVSKSKNKNKNTEKIFFPIEICSK